MLANDMGIDAIARFMGSIGLGQRTGVDIGKDDSGESKGILPSQEWKGSASRSPEQQKWYAGETISIGIGQGYNAYTPIQLAQAVATLANDGVMFRPIWCNTSYRRRDRRKAHRRAAAHAYPQTGKPQNVEVIKRAMVGVKRKAPAPAPSPGHPTNPPARPARPRSFSLKGANYKESGVRRNCATTPCSSPSPPWTNRASPWPSWSRTAASAPSRRPHRPHGLRLLSSGQSPAGAANEDAAAVRRTT